MQAERYVSGFKFTYISPPNAVTNSQLFTNNSNGHFNPNFFYYDQTYDADPNPDNEKYSEWEENDYENAWIYAHDNDYNGSGITLNTPGRGYAYYNDINKMFVFDGIFTTGDKDITITHNDNDDNNGYFDGWNLIANPYPSALDWNDASWTKTNVDAAIYYWDGTNSNEGNYKYYVSSGNYDDGTDVVNGGSQMIPATQAFFIKAKDSDASGNGTTDSYTLTIPNDARIHSTQDFWGKNNTKSNSSQFIRLQATANNATDELVVRYIDEGTTNFDGQYDAYKMYSTAANVPQIYSYNNDLGVGYAINSLPIIEMENTIPIGVEISKRGESDCVFELTESNIENQHIYFEDVDEVVVQNLLINPTYSYTIADSSDIRGRFNISFIENLAPIVSNNIPDYAVDYGDTINYTIPTNSFFDLNDGDILTYSATHSGGMALPYWLEFDCSTGNFYGITVKAGSCVVTVTATDIFGQKVSDDFIMAVNAVLPDVSTDEVILISHESATVLGILLSNGGQAGDVGVCWNTSQNPDLNDNFAISTLDGDNFLSTLNDLTQNTLYYVRTFATNSAGTKYGNELSFTTLIVDIEDINTSQTYVYPNPTNDILYIKNTETEQIEVQISDVFGKILLTKIISENDPNYKIDLSQYASGIYLITLKTTDNTIFEKIIKK